jgi:Mpv17 / PMP22 family
VILDQCTYGPVCNVLLISCKSSVPQVDTSSHDLVDNADSVVHGMLKLPSCHADLSLVVEGRSAQHTQQRLKRDYPGIQWNGWKLWPLAAFINYTYVPLKLRVLFVNVVAFCW